MEEHRVGLLCDTLLNRRYPQVNSGRNSRPGPFRTGTLHTYCLTWDHACVTGKVKICFVTGCKKNRKTIRAIRTADPIRWLQRRPCAGSHNSWQARHLSKKHVQV